MHAVEISTAAVVTESRKVDIDFDVPFELTLRTEEEQPRRLKRENPRKLPAPATTTCSPFTFTLSFAEDTSKSFAIELKIVRSSRASDAMFRHSIRFTYTACRFGGSSRTLKAYSGFGSVDRKLGSAVGDTLQLRGVARYEDLPTFFGEKEPIEFTARLTTAAETSFSAPPRERTTIASQVLDVLPYYVDSPSPNNVGFVLSKFGNKRLYASKTLLASSSTYFREAFNPSRRSSRTPFSSDPSPSFVDDSDAEEEAAEEEPESEEDLPHPDQIGTRSGSKRAANASQTGEGEGGTPSKKRRKTGGAKREEEEADQGGEGKGVGKQDMTEIHVDDVEYSTLRALLVFLIGGKIQFAPLSSQGRAAFMKQYREEHPLALNPVSCRSIYRLAVRFRLPALQDLAISHLKSCLDESTAAIEALGDDCYHFPAFRDAIHDHLVQKWSTVSRSDTWKDVLRRAKQKEFSHTDSLLPDLLEKVANAT